MSLRNRFLFFLGCAAVAGLVAGGAWSLRAGVIVSLSLFAGAWLGTLFSGKEQIEPADASPFLVKPRRETARTDAHARALLEAMLEGMREGMLVIDEAMRVVASNLAAREIFRGVGGALEGRRLSELTRNPAVNSAFTASLQSSEQAGARVEMEGPGGPIFDLRVVPLSLDDEKGARGAMGVFFNITRLERLERVRQEFLSNVSHELRTPLTAIIAFVETLEDGAVEDATSNRRFLHIIRKNAERMHHLIDDILELSAIEAGTVEVSIEPVRLRSLVADVLTALARRAEVRKVELVNEVSTDALVSADARRLEQMLTNLIDNAIKFNRERGSVIVSHKRGESDRIVITDTGDGIPPEHVKRIFERFYRVDRARSREMGGTGLGLAIVKHLARAHNGEVSVQSTPGEGSIFVIELPVSTLEEPKQPEPAMLSAKP